MTYPFGDNEIDYYTAELDPQFAGLYEQGMYPGLRGAGSSSSSSSISPGTNTLPIPRTGAPPIPNSTPVYGGSTPATYPGGPSPFMPIGGALAGAGVNQALSPGSDAITGVMPGVLEGGGVGDYLLPGAGIALGGYGLYNTLTGDKTKAGGAIQGGLSGAATGAGIGSFMGPGGTAIGAGIGGALGLGAGLLSGRDKPHPEQLDRQRALGQLGDVSKGLNSRAYNIANNRPDTPAGQAVGALNPLSAILTSRQGSEGFNNPDPNKRRSDLTGIMTNAALDSGHPTEAITQRYADAGLTHDSAYQAILQLRQEGQIADDATRDAYLAGIDKLYGVVNPNAAPQKAPYMDEMMQQVDKNKKPPTDYEMSARK